MKIRQLYREDLLNPKFRTQFFQLLDTTELSQDEALIVFDDRRDVVTFVAVENDLPIATASVVLEHKFIRGGMKYGHIEDVNTHPHHRGQGIGPEILEHALKWADLPCGKLILECQPGLEQFYALHGFKTTGITMKRNNAENQTSTERSLGSSDTVTETKTNEIQCPLCYKLLDELDQMDWHNLKNECIHCNCDHCKQAIRIVKLSESHYVADSKVYVQRTSTETSTERRLRAANKMANAVSRFHNKYMRGASDEVIEDELIEMKKTQTAFWDAGTEPSFSRENEDSKGTNQGSTGLKQGTWHSMD